MNHKKNIPFKLPEGYFENFNERLETRLNASSNDLPKKDGFSVPEQYFDLVTQKVLLKTVHTTEGKVVSLFNYRAWMGVAASVVLLVASYFMFFNETETNGFDDLAASEIEAYLQNSEYALNLTDSDISETLPISEFEMVDFLEGEDHTTEIMNYLEESIDEYSTIYETYDDE